MIPLPSSLKHPQPLCTLSEFLAFLLACVDRHLRVHCSEVLQRCVDDCRCSSAFFNEERTALRQKRQKMRLLQQGKMSDVSNCKDLPDEIPLRLNIGTKVTGEIRTRAR